MQIEPREPDAMREEPESGLPPRWTRLRYVRCEACGAKALVAASQCPQCEEPLELRDSFGQQVPLAHCQTCDLYYPRKKGKCIWCGTAPKSFPISGVVWGGVATVAFAGLVWGAWWAKTAELAPPLISPTTSDTAALVVVPKYSETATSKSSTGEAAVAASVASADSAADSTIAASNDADSAQRDEVASNDRPVATAGVGAAPAEPTPSEPAPTPTPVDPPSAGTTRSSAPPASVPRATRPVIDNLPPPDTRNVPETRAPEARPPEIRPAPEPRAVPETRTATETRVARGTTPPPATVKKPSNSRAAPATRSPDARTSSVARAPSTRKAPVVAKATTRPAPKVASAPTPRRTTTGPRSARARWVSATVRGWVRVRSGASHDSRTIAMVGPDTRLQVGEARGGWIRIRSAGATGWVEQQQLHKNSTFRQPRASTGSGTGR